jgi:hypothetical protein
MPRTQRGWRDRKVFVSAKAKEITYGTPLGTPVDTAFRVNTAPFRMEKERTPDLDLVGGTEEVGSFDELSRIVRGSLGLPFATPHFLAFGASYALGAVATTTPEVGKTARLHEITPKTSDYLLDAFTVEEILAGGAAVQKQYPGCMVDAFTLRVRNGGWWEAQVDVIGKGTVNAGSASPSAVSEAFLGAKDTKIWFSTGTFDGSLTQSKTTPDLLATTTEISAILRDCEWSVRNNINVEELREFNSGLYLARAERDRRSQTFSMTLEYKDDDPMLGYFLGANEQDLSVELECFGSVLAGDAVGMYYGFDLLFPKLRIADYDFTEALGKSLLRLNFSVMQHATHGSVRFGVMNAQTGYLQ